MKYCFFKEDYKIIRYLFKQGIQAGFIFSILIISFTDNIFSQMREIKKYDTTVQIWTEKNHFYTLEEIWLYIRVENRDEEGPVIPDFALDEYIVVKNSKGVEYNRTAYSFIVGVPKMKPGDVYETDFDLSSAYINRNDYIMDNYWYTYLPPETYTIYFERKERFAEPIISNKVEITILDPKGDELQAFKLLKEGIKKNQDKSNVFDEPFEKLVNIYPNSIYTGKALYIIIGRLQFKKGLINAEKRMKFAKKLLEDYPESKFRSSGFAGVIDYHIKKKDMPGLKKYMIQLDQKSKDKHIKKIIKSVLKNIDEGKYEKP